MVLFQIALNGNPPVGPLFRTEEEARREIGFYKMEDERYAADALEQGGVIVEPSVYTIHKV